MSVSPTLEEYKNGYYAQNCPQENFSWFDDWEYLAYVSHTISLFLVPLNIYGGYCILCQTPKRMEGTKWIMLNLHIWTSYLDIMISSMLTPYLFLPMMCGLTVGIFNWLGIHQLVQTFCAASGLAAVGVSLVVIFENRHNVVATDRWMITGKKARIAFYVINYGYACVFMTPTYLSVPEQETAKIKLLKIVPCPTRYYFDPNMFVLMDMEGRMFIQAQCTTFFCFLILEGTFFVVRTVYFLMAKNPSLSEKTREMQRKFFRSVCIQVAIPVLVVIFPVLYCGMAIEWYWYYQRFTNTAVICISFHGISSTLAILFIYEPYRTYTKHLFRRLICRKSSTPVTPVNLSVTPKRSQTSNSRRTLAIPN